MVFHVITFYIFYTRVLPSECFAFPETNLKLLLQAGLSRTFKLVTLVSSNCICVVCIQCLIYMIDTPIDKRNLAELMTFFLNKPLFRPHESQAFRDLL